jgi:gamma-glutamyltranspeptidase/glutathione hydrolase
MNGLGAALCAFAVAVVFAAAGCASQPMPKIASPQLEPGHWDGSVMSEQDQRYHPMIGTKGMVVADDPVAAQWGAEILRRGGNAIDAAVATGFAMAVTRPQHSSIGGGGFMIYCPAPEAPKAVAAGVSGGPAQASASRSPSAAPEAAHSRRPLPTCYALDYREKSPAAATRDMYVRDGKPRTDLSQNGALASGVPGVTAGLLTALERFGSMPRQKLLARPIELARQGYSFTSHQESTAQERWEDFNPETRKTLGCPAKPGAAPTGPCTPGATIRQADLARTLEAISQGGINGFYQGAVAKKLVDGLKASGGIMTLDDLKGYKPQWREPVRGEYRGMEVVSMPPPSAGGTVLLQMLGFMDRADRQGQLDEGYGSAKAVHAIASAMSIAFADRAKHFGDPDHVKVPVDTLLSPAYLDERWKLFDPSRFTSPAGAGEIAASVAARGDAGADARAGASAAMAPLAQLPQESMHTTHFSVVDRHGNAVAITTTVNDDYGSGFTPPGTGVVMNNEMDDFSIQPGVPNLFGLIGAEANAVAPGKRPLSSMSPTVVRDARSGQVRLVIGAAGGPTITTSVFLSIVNRLRFGMSLTDAVAAARVHQQWRPDELRFERQGLSSDTLARLAEKGHTLVSKGAIARVHAIERFGNGRTWGVPDFRGEGGGAAE